MWDRGYYYQHKRIDGKPRRVYVGGGLLGELAARLDARDQAQRAAQDTQRRLQRARDRDIHRAIDGEYQRLRGLVAALLEASGYYQHKREWRKMGKKAAQLAGPDTGPAVDIEALVKRANGPKVSRADLDALQAALDAQDDAGAIVTALDGASIQNQIIEKATESEASRRVLIADVKRMGRTFGRHIAPPFERPLIDHIVTCWLRLQLVELQHTRELGGGHTRENGGYWDRRLTEAQRRYLRAMNLLAKLRHLGPAVQVNVANQQVVMNGPNNSQAAE
jgi:hypothetical protein